MTRDLDFNRVASALERAIVRSELSPGDRLPSERMIASKHSVSRSVARQALQVLASRGLININNRSRATVARSASAGFASGVLDAHIERLIALPKGQEDFQEARAIFECGLARHAALHATAKQLVLLAGALRENRKSIGDTSLFSKTDVAFHRTIAEIPGNTFVLLVQMSIARWIEANSRVILKQNGSMEAAYTNHEAIYAAISSHDVLAAQNTMENHLQNVARRFFSALYDLK